jgi:hypothetical protein
MKKLAIIAVSLIALPAAADGDTRIRTTLTGYQEVPAVSTLATGRLVLTINRAGDSIDYTLSYTGVKDVRQAHIHFAQKSVNGPVVVWLCGTPTNPGPALTPTCPEGTGSVGGTIVAANVLASPPAQQLGPGEILELIAAMRAGAAYTNVHTAVSGGGEIRGQIGKSNHEDDDD